MNAKRLTVVTFENQTSFQANDGPERTVLLANNEPTAIMAGDHCTWDPATDCLYFRRLQSDTNRLHLRRHGTVLSYLHLPNFKIAEVEDLLDNAAVSINLSKKLTSVSAGKTTFTIC